MPKIKIKPIKRYSIIRVKKIVENNVQSYDESSRPFQRLVDHKLFSQFVEPIVIIYFFLLILGPFLKINVTCQREKKTSRSTHRALDPLTELLTVKKT